MKNKKNEQLLIICIITVFMGQVYLTPVSTWFRFSLAAVVLPLFLIFFKETSIWISTLIIAVSMFLFRSLVHDLTYDDLAFSEIMSHYIPVVIYYLIYGALFASFKIREKSETHAGISLILALWVCDSSGNIAEALIRSLWKGLALESAILIAILIGLTRAIVAYLIYRLISQYKTRFEREQKETKFRELLLLTAKLKSELFFLKKSMNDIETTMTESYELYQELHDINQKDKALNISKNIHEIKKDYYRVVLGMENTLTAENKPISLSASNLFAIIKENTEKLITLQQKDIKLQFDIRFNFCTDDYYPLISILNNLITNAIDAISKNGIVSIRVVQDNKHCLFYVYDNGAGIDADDLNLIFKPGFSTKICTTTGKHSTGLGLSHVKFIVEDYYQGTISVSSYMYEHTEFMFKIPLEKLALQEGA